MTGATMKTEQDFIWLDIDVTIADLVDAVRGDDVADVRAMLETLREHLAALRAEVRR